MPDLRATLRAIVHSLKMRTFSGVNPNSMLEFQTRIKKLPSAERIASMTATELEELRGRVDRLVFAIDAADNLRTKGHELRHRLEKNLPPLRPTLLASNWYQKTNKIRATAVEWAEKHG